MKKLLLVTAALVAAVAVLVGVTPRRRGAWRCPLDERRSAAPADGTVPGAFHVHTNRSDGLQHARRDRGRRGARRAEVHRVHRSRRRHAHARSAGVSIRRAVPRRRGDQHRRRPLHRARHAGVAVSARRRGARRRRGRPPARRVRHRRASGFAEAGAALARVGAPIDGDRARESGHQLARVGGAGRRIGREVVRRGDTSPRRCSTIRSGRPKPSPA